jgi:hypothetical protein
MTSCQKQDFEPGCIFNTDKTIKQQYGNWCIFSSKLNSSVISKVLGFY